MSNLTDEKFYILNLTEKYTLILSGTLENCIIGTIQKKNSLDFPWSRIFHLSNLTGMILGSHLCNC